MRIVVTGAAGFIGSHLADSLARAGHSVIGIDAFTDYYDIALKEKNAEIVRDAGATILRLDLAEDNLVEALKGAEIIYHLAAQPGISSDTPFELYERNNILATHRLLEAASDVPSIKAFVNISTSSVYGNQATGDETRVPTPTSFYGVTKLAAEELALSYGRAKRLPVTSLRIFSVYGERERPEKFFPKLIKSAFSGDHVPLFAGSETHRRSFTYVGDVVRALERIIDVYPQCLGEIINVGNPTSVSVQDVIDSVAFITGKTIAIDTKPARSGDQITTQAVVAKAEKLLGYIPLTPLDEGLEKEIAWVQSL